MATKILDKDDNSFVKLRNGAGGHVQVMMRPGKVQNSDGSTVTGYYGRVTRFTYSNQNVLDLMADELPDMTTGRIADVMTAYTKVILDILGSGNAVKFGALGTFYIAAKGISADPNFHGPLTVRFTPEPLLIDSVSKVEVSDTRLSVRTAQLSKVTDVGRAESDGTIVAGNTVLVQGSGLKTDDGEDSGIWIAQAKEDGSGYKSTDEGGSMQKITTVFRNTDKMQMFTIPKNLDSGTYCFVLRTRWNRHGAKLRENFIEGVSPAFEVLKQ